MIKRTLIAIAVVAFLTASAHAALDIKYFPIGDSHAVKVDGKWDPENPWWNRWPLSISYSPLRVCTIPIKMNIGMYVQVLDCKKKKLVLDQVDCGDIGKGAGDFPCYYGEVSFDVIANFEVKMGQELEKVGDVIDQWSCSYIGGDVVPGDGNPHPMKVSVSAWKARIYKHAAGDEVDVGKLHITVKPNV